MTRRWMLITRASCLLALCLASSAYAQDTFRSDLTPIIPTQQNTWFPAGAEFSFDGVSVGFNIRFGLESVVPTDARITSSSSDIVFDLGTPLIAIHSPGPWPDGYDGATAFYGSFALPEDMREDFAAGRTELLLVGSGAGDFRGAIVPVPEPASLSLMALSGLAALRRTGSWSAIRAARPVGKPAKPQAEN